MSADFTPDGEEQFAVFLHYLSSIFNDSPANSIDGIQHIFQMRFLALQNQTQDTQKPQRKDILGFRHKKCFLNTVNIKVQRAKALWPLVELPVTGQWRSLP